MVEKYIDFETCSNGNLIVPIYTPFGGVTLWFDGEPVTSKVMHIDADNDYALSHPVDGNVRVWFDFKADGNTHVLECKVRPLFPGEISPASGERLEGFEIHDEETILFIGVEYDSESEVGFDVGQYDYTAVVIDNGVKVEINPDTHSQLFVFGIAWVDYVDEKMMANTWLVGDPCGDRNVNFD